MDTLGGNYMYICKVTPFLLSQICMVTKISCSLVNQNNLDYIVMSLFRVTLIIVSCHSHFSCILQ